MCNKTAVVPRIEGISLGVFWFEEVAFSRRSFLNFQMPVRLELDPPPPANSVQAGVATSLLYSGSKFRGSQKSKGNCYDVEVILQVTSLTRSHSNCQRH